MKIFVTGAAGFIGSHFVAAAEHVGHEVIGLDMLTYAGRSANLTTEQRARMRLVDICDRPIVDALLEEARPDAIVHLAAESHVARSIECRDEFARTNVMGTLVLLEAALDYWCSLPGGIGSGDLGFRFLHVSTDEVYGSLGPAEPAWTEASPYAPNNPYAASKAASDHLVRSYVKTFGLPAIITHSSNNYGPKQHPEKLIPTLIGQIQRGEPMTLHGDGTNVRDWLHVEDHCQGLLRALTFGKPGETYNFGGLCERSNIQIATLVHCALGMPGLANIRLVEDRPGNDARYATDISKAARALSWLPESVSISDRIRETARWYVRHPDYALDYGR